MPSTMNPHGLLEALPGVTDEDLQGTVGEQAAALTAKLDAYQHARRKVLADEGLNHIGRRDRLRQLAEATLQAIEQTASVRYGAHTAESLGRAIEHQQVTLANRLDAVPTPDGHGLTRVVPKDERQLAELRERELRDRLLALKPDDRYAVALTAAERNDVELLRAIAHAPQSFPILPPEHFAQVERAHIDTHHAPAGARLRALENLQSTLTYNTNAARRAVQGSGSGTRDTLRAAARGDTKPVGADPQVSADTAA